MPAVVTVLAFQWLVPAIGTGAPGFVAALGRRSPLLLGAALFVLFSALAHYWLGDSHSATSRGSALGWVAWVAIAASGALGFRAFVARPYRVHGASMLPTLAPEDLVAGTVRKPSSTSGFHRGDVVVFAADGLLAAHTAETGPEALVKRVVGLPGDRIEMRGGAPVINGWPVPICDAGEYLHVSSDTKDGAIHGRLRVEFLDDITYLTLHSFRPPFTGSVVVASGELFVLGDDRGNSLDSRDFHQGRGGGVPVAAIEARVDRFLVGSHRSGDADFTRLLRPIDTLATRLRLEGLATGALEEGIARCLANRPSVTHAPPSEIRK